MRSFRAASRCAAQSARLVRPPSSLCSARALHQGVCGHPASQFHGASIQPLHLKVRGFAALIDVPCPEFGAESIVEGTVLEWKKGVGEFAASGELLASIETDKVTVEFTAPQSGYIREILVPADGNATVGQTLIKLEPSDDAPAGAPAPAPAPASAAPAPAPAPAAAAPAAAHTGELKGIRAGFAKAAAMRAYKAGTGPPPDAAVAAPAAKKAAAAPATPVSVPSTGRGERRVPMTLPRAHMVATMKNTQNTAALLTTFQECDVGVAQDVCKKYEQSFEKMHGAPLGLLALFVKATASALSEIPAVNAVITEQEIVYRDFVDIGVPIPSPRGVVTCFIRNAENMSVAALAQQIASLRTKARKDELSVEDITSGTFSISDSGSSGGMLGMPMISPPMSACLGTNAVKQRPVAVGSKVVARPMMYMALTYDHRLIDGREAVTFLCSIRDKLEDPVRLVLDV